eukprot:1464789-Amphidinium_carterae.7
MWAVSNPSAGSPGTSKVASQVQWVVTNSEDLALQSRVRQLSAGSPDCARRFCRRPGHST